MCLKNIEKCVKYCLQLFETLIHLPHQVGLLVHQKWAQNIDNLIPNYPKKWCHAGGDQQVITEMLQTQKELQLHYSITCNLLFCVDIYLTKYTFVQNKICQLGCRLTHVIDVKTCVNRGCQVTTARFRTPQKYYFCYKAKQLATFQQPDPR